MKKIIYKKYFLILVIFLIGCSNKNQEVNILKGSGLESEELITGITEIGQGKIWDFIGNTNTLLISPNFSSNKEVTFKSINISSKSNDPSLKNRIPSSNINSTLFSSSFEDNYQAFFSDDGRYILYGKQLYDTTKNVCKTIDINNYKTSKSKSFISIAPYCLLPDSSIIITDPSYYNAQINTSKEVKNILANSTNTNVKVEQVKTYLKNGTSKMADFESIKKLYYLPDQFKTVFIANTLNNTQKLYVVDIEKNTLKEIGNNVKNFTLSKEFHTIAYHDVSNGNSSIIVYNLDDETYKSLSTTGNILDLVYLNTKDWIIFATETSNKPSLWAIKDDNSICEQLTSNINFIGNLKSSIDGTQIAFNSSNIITDPNSNSNVLADTNNNINDYIYTMNLKIPQSNNKKVIHSTSQNDNSNLLLKSLIELTKININFK